MNPYETPVEAVVIEDNKPAVDWVALAYTFCFALVLGAAIEAVIQACVSRVAVNPITRSIGLK